jgi:hypothetical protein
MLVFNFHKMIDMHKSYTYQFSHFIPTQKSRINVCVMCPYYALKESK